MALLVGAIGLFTDLERFTVRHITSFIKAPLGYVANLISTLLVHAERAPLVGRAAEWAGLKMADVCEVVCIRDGVQDDMLF